MNDLFVWIDPFEEIERRSRQSYARGVDDGTQRGRSDAVRLLTSRGYEEGLDMAARRLADQAMNAPEATEAIEKVKNALRAHGSHETSMVTRMDVAETFVMQRVAVRPFEVVCGLRVDAR